MMNRQRCITGLIVILGLILGFGIWQQRSQAAGPNRQGVQQVASSATGNGLVSPALRPATAAPMATITVQSLGDGAANAANCPGVNCRLRDAIAAAVAGDTIDFSVTGSIIISAFNGGQLGIDKNLTIQGPGAALLEITAFNSSRIFRILPGVTVALSGMTVADGQALDFGGGIYNSGTLTIVDSIFSRNKGVNQGGGGIFNDGILTVTNTTFSNNYASPSGGGISNWGTATVINSTFFANTAHDSGGGINNNGTLTIINSTFSCNTADLGGAIYNEGNRTLTIINSTISGNSANTRGGGVATALA